METDNERKKGNTYCCVPECRNYGRKGLSFHKFPSGKNLRKRWETVLKLGKPSSKFMRVCSEHFTEFDYFPGDVKIRRNLKRNVIPSKKLPGRSDKMVQVVKQLRVYPPSQYTRRKKDNSDLNKSDGSTCRANLQNEASPTIIKEEKIEFNVDNVLSVPVEFETHLKLDKACLVDEFYPDNSEETFFCNRYLTGEKICDVEIQTYIVKIPNVIVKLEPIFEGEDSYYERDLKTEVVYLGKKEPLSPESVLCKRETSPETILP